MKKYLKFLFLLLIFSFAPEFVDSVFSQPPPPTPIAIPIDGGISALIAAGVGYAGKKLYSERNKSKV